MKRIFLIVLDSLGIGAAPDADKFGDSGANTLKRISASQDFNIPNLIDLGLGSIDGIDYLDVRHKYSTSTARLEEISAGKDTTIGHWEIAGIISNDPLPTYPDGFPKEILERFSLATGRGVLCNKPYSGTEVIEDYGDEHLKSGKLIVYTSADSVFQIAADEAIVPTSELYEYCASARKILQGKHGVGRVIARPFITENGKRIRTANRRDFSLPPHSRTVLDALSENGLDVISVGKIEDIFASRSISESYHSKSNADGMRITSELIGKDFCGLCFINLVDFDSKYGHRQDTDGYAKALSEFDAWLGGFISELRDEDVLIITADHGCDPGDTHTDHTREYVPLIVYGKEVKQKNIGTVKGFTAIAALISDVFGLNYQPSSYEKISDKVFYRKG
ncbi:MAG: phosphopentomutase [Clostridia bacterium]|nr:phosphopentomutase [Clostridia bacterium]